MSVFTSSAVPINCAYCGRPILEDTIYWSGLCYHKQCTNPHNTQPMDRAPTSPPYEAFLKMQIIEKDKRIALLEKENSSIIDINEKHKQRIAEQDTEIAALRERVKGERLLTRFYKEW
jgi:hypothetical protein